MTTEHFTDDMIETAIKRKDDPDHEDAISVREVRQILLDIQKSLVEHWDMHLDTIDDGGLEIVHEDESMIVLADHTGHGWNEEFDAAGVENRTDQDVILDVVHQAAREHCDYSWMSRDPFVLRKPMVWQLGEMHARRTIAKLARDGGSIARGVDVWATQRQNQTLKSWGDWTNRSQQAVSKNKNRGQRNE